MSALDDSCQFEVTEIRALAADTSALRSYKCSPFIDALANTIGQCSNEGAVRVLDFRIRSGASLGAQVAAQMPPTFIRQLNTESRAMIGRGRPPNPWPAMSEQNAGWLLNRVCHAATDGYANVNKPVRTWLSAPPARLILPLRGITIHGLV
jgi:hypothetical protein